MTALAWPRVQDAMVALATSACGCLVSDADMLTDDPASLWIEVGISGDDTGRAGTMTGDHHDLGRNTPPREEVGTIFGRVVAQTGDDDLVPLRAAAFGALDDLSDAIRANPTLGLDGVVYVQLAAGDVFQGRTADGGFVTVEFACDYRALI